MVVEAVGAVEVVGAVKVAAGGGRGHRVLGLGRTRFFPFHERASDQMNEDAWWVKDTFIEIFGGKAQR